MNFCKSNEFSENPDPSEEELNRIGFIHYYPLLIHSEKQLGNLWL